MHLLLFLTKLFYQIKDRPASSGSQALCSLSSMVIILPVRVSITSLTPCFRSQRKTSTHLKYSISACASVFRGNIFSEMQKNVKRLLQNSRVHLSERVILILTPFLHMQFAELY